MSLIPKFYEAKIWKETRRERNHTLVLTAFFYRLAMIVEMFKGSTDRMWNRGLTKSFYMSHRRRPLGKNRRPPQTYIKRVIFSPLLIIIPPYLYSLLVFTSTDMILTIDKKLPQNLKLNLNLSLSYPRKKVSYCCFLI